LSGGDQPYARRVTVLEVIQRSTDFLARREVDSPRLQAEWLLAGAMGIPRLELYLQFDRQVTEPDIARVRDWVRRRGQREPLQHILGTATFCGFEIKVNRAVLVPRPETELLAQQALDWCRNTSVSEPVILDFGTGSGCLAVTLAANCPQAVVHAIDLSPEALAVAGENAARHNLTRRIHYQLSDGFKALPADLKFDLVVANPPYIPNAEIDTLQIEVRDFDPRMALDGGKDGLDFYRRLAQETGERLRPDGRVMVEHGDGQAEAVSNLFKEQKWIVESRRSDYSDQLRILTVQRHG
jgi:release factor glutamine methyltransferase